jgi:hypothetical protein
VGKLFGVVVAIAIGLILAAFCIWFLFTPIKTLVTVPLQAPANSRGTAKIVAEPPNATKRELTRLRELTKHVADHMPRQLQMPGPGMVPYKSILGFRISADLAFCSNNRVGSTTPVTGPSSRSTSLNAIRIAL